MASTGEVGTISDNKYRAFLKSYLSTGDFKIPAPGSNILICADYHHELQKFMNTHLAKLAEMFKVFIFTDY